MNAALNPLERVVLFATDEEGRIPIPRGEKRGVRTIRTAIVHLEKQGIVARGHEGHRDQIAGGNHLLFVLTSLGKRIKKEMEFGQLHHH